MANAQRRSESPESRTVINSGRFDSRVRRDDNRAQPSSLRPNSAPPGSGSKWLPYRANHQADVHYRPAGCAECAGKTTVPGANRGARRRSPIKRTAGPNRGCQRSMTGEDADFPHVETGRLRYDNGCTVWCSALKEGTKLDQRVDTKALHGYGRAGVGGKKAVRKFEMNGNIIGYGDRT